MPVRIMSQPSLLTHDNTNTNNNIRTFLLDGEVSMLRNGAPPYHDHFPTSIGTDDHIIHEMNERGHLISDFTARKESEMNNESSLLLDGQEHKGIGDWNESILDYVS